MKRIPHTKVKRSWLSDSIIKKEYDNLKDEFVLLKQMLMAREKAGKTQEDVAKIMKTTKSAVSRLESLPGKRKSAPSIATLKRYARAVNCDLAIKFIPKHKIRASDSRQG